MFILGGILLGVVIMAIILTLAFVGVYFLKKESLTVVPLRNRNATVKPR